MSAACTRPPAWRGYHALVRFFGWLVAEDELSASPMTTIRAPVAALPQPRVLGDEEVGALLAACAGPAFEDVRDAAMIRLLLDTGLRRTELAALRLDDVDLELNAVYVAGAGRPPRAAPFDKATARALDRYLAARAMHPWAHMPNVWLGRRRGLTDRGVDQAIRHRGELAGVPNVHAHYFRHTFVHRYLAEGGDGRDLMRLVGWKSRQLLARYGASSLEKTTTDRHRAWSLGDRL